MRRLFVIGIGTGNPEHITVQAINRLNGAELILIPRKGDAKDGLAELRREICKRYVTNVKTRIIEFDLPTRDIGRSDYDAGVRDWHATIAETYRGLLASHSDDAARTALLVWGDPSLYDSTLRIIERLKEIADFPFDYEVVPGISSLQALAASHRIALNTVGDPVHITTGRKLKEGFPPNANSALVMLDGDCAFRTLPGDAFDIFWSAYLGMTNEINIAGRLSDVVEQIVDTRADARRQTGWIMDTYLLRRR